MFSAFRSIALLLSATANLKVAKGQWLRAYFLAQIIYDLALFAGRTRSEYYAMMFTVLTFVILAASAGYVFQCLNDAVAFKFRASVVVATAFVPYLLGSFAATVLKISYGDCIPSKFLISLGECISLIMLGMMMAAIAPIVRGVSLQLSLLWLSLGAWEYVWTLTSDRFAKRFYNLNQWLPAALIILAFTWIFYEHHRTTAAGRGSTPVSV